MNSKQDSMPTSYANPAFDEEPNGVRNSAGASPMGSNIFIVKPDDASKGRAHSQPYRHDPVTSQNFGRTILRGIRCRIISDENQVFYSSSSSSTLGNTTNGKRSSQKQRFVRENNHSRIDSLLSFHHHPMHQ